jgi:hypothetical protein
MLGKRFIPVIYTTLEKAWEEAAFCVRLDSKLAPYFGGLGFGFGISMFGPKMSSA